MTFFAVQTFIKQSVFGLSAQDDDDVGSHENDGNAPKNDNVTF